MGITGLIAGVLWMIGLSSASTWWYPATASAFDDLRRIGDPAQVAASIDEELAGDTVRCGPVQFTMNWMVIDHAGEILLVRLADVIRASHTTSPKRVNGVEVGTHHHLKITTGHGEWEVKIPFDRTADLFLLLEQRTAPGQVRL